MNQPVCKFIGKLHRANTIGIRHTHENTFVILSQCVYINIDFDIKTYTYDGDGGDCFWIQRQTKFLPMFQSVCRHFGLFFLSLRYTNGSILPSCCLSVYSSRFCISFIYSFTISSDDWLFVHFYNLVYSFHRCSFIHPLLFTFVCSHNNNERLLLTVIWLWEYISHSWFLYLSIIIKVMYTHVVYVKYCVYVSSNTARRILSISYLILEDRWMLKSSRMHIVISRSTSKLVLFFLFFFLCFFSVKKYRCS